MRRVIAAAFVSALVAACGPPGTPWQTPSPQDAPATPRVTSAHAPFTLDRQALLGTWSFDRSCGLYELVFADEDTPSSVLFFEYVDGSTAVTHAGTFALVPNHRVVLSMHAMDNYNRPVGEAETYNLDVSSPVTDDLNGSFGPAGGEMRTINAKRCPEEDRD